MEPVHCRLGLAERLEFWETTYHHELPDHRALVEWYKGTGMRPCLERLPDEPSRRAFGDAVLEGCRADYPVQPNGRVIYPFRRLSFIAYARRIHPRASGRSLQRGGQVAS